MGSKLDAADVARPRPRAARPMRSRLAKPLLTSLGAATMLAAASFVVLAVSSTGSVRPWDWTRADPAGALSRYQVCGERGLGAVGCMLSAGARPAAAAEPVASRGSAQPLISVATVPDQAPAGSTARPASGSAPARSAVHGVRPATAPTAVDGTQHLVRVPAGASSQEVLAACQAAMRTAVPQGATAMREVETECQADLAPHCAAAAAAPPVQGATELQELEDECEAPVQPSPGASPGHDD